MALSFTVEDPVLNFNPRPHARAGKREYLLWPAWAYRVVAPRVRPRSLNMFQRAVLGLCRAGVVGVNVVGQKLSIHKDLATFILVELSNLGYIDGNGRPTEQGLLVLAGDTIEMHEMVAGYIFQDPWNGELWPRFVEHMDYCELEYEDSGFPILLLGSPGKPWRQWAFMVRPVGLPDAARPTPASVVAAVSSQRKRMRYANEFMEIDENLDNPYFAPSAVHINRVSFVEEKPDPVYLMTYLYLIKEPAESSDWHACDPFGLGGSVRLRRRVVQTMQSLPPLYKVVNRLVERGLHEGLEEQKRWIDRLRQRAELEVERRLTVNIRESKTFEQIVNMEFSKQEVALLGRDCPESKYKAALRDCSKTLEALFGVISDQHPLGDVWKRVHVERTNRRTSEKNWVPQKDLMLLKEIFRSAAVEVGFQKPIPKSFLNIKPGYIRSVAEYGNRWRLRSLVVACLLAAQLDIDHPLRKAAERDPHLLQCVEEVAHQGGMAGHANDQKVTHDEVNTTVECTYKVISILSGVDELNSQFVVTDNGKNYDER